MGGAPTPKWDPIRFDSAILSEENKSAHKCHEKPGELQVAPKGSLAPNCQLFPSELAGRSNQTELFATKMVQTQKVTIKFETELRE